MIKIQQWNRIWWKAPIRSICVYSDLLNMRTKKKQVDILLLSCIFQKRFSVKETTCQQIDREDRDVPGRNSKRMAQWGPLLVQSHHEDQWEGSYEWEAAKTTPREPKGAGKWYCTPLLYDWEDSRARAARARRPT